ncbi:hypothetical protein PMES_01656 [Profundibacterium mesophilum KAUST100406-0324]|uniref:Uncharacterized protein n=1 Tax=Profundibacterium mesophilum KAUST100406-0324 TaxID=1037889 RepID=A0A921NUP0_9RHOB|nr:hypothetical protein PMES_01656 [Profundibacterium mesophilum KAUST100406-0324]
MTEDDAPRENTSGEGPRRFATGREMHERLARSGPPHPVTLEATERAALRRRPGQNIERKDD